MTSDKSKKILLWIAKNVVAGVAIAIIAGAVIAAVNAFVTVQEFQSETKQADVFFEKEVEGLKERVHRLESLLMERANSK